MLDLKPRGESYDPDPKMEENLRQAFVPQDAKVCPRCSTFRSNDVDDVDDVDGV